MAKLIVYLFLTLLVLNTSAQNYNNLLNYNYNSTPTHGVKIKTNLPFTPGSQMPTIILEGYNYGASEPIGLKLTYYIYSGGSDFYNPVNYYFYSPSVSSFGAYTPNILLSNEDGKVVIFINDRSYYQRFTVSAFAQGMISEQTAHFQGWTVADEPLSGTKTVQVPYKNKFAGNVVMPGSGIWNDEGNVGINTTSPKEKLSVNGKIRAHEVKVETVNWPDYVFEKGYKLEELERLENFIKVNKHLPEIPSAAEVEREGISLGEMNAKLLKKIEELTLYVIDQNKRLEQQRKEHEKQMEKSKEQEKEVDQLRREIDHLKNNR